MIVESGSPGPQGADEDTNRRASFAGIIVPVIPADAGIHAASIDGGLDSRPR
jgi:hypothetical protein